MNMNKQKELFPNLTSSLEVINFTELSVFQRCPLEFRFRFNPRDKSFDPQGPEVYLGRLLHILASKYLSKPVSKRKTFLSQAVFDSMWHKYRKYFQSNDNYYKIIMNVIAKLREGFLSNVQVFACEYSFKTTYRNLVIKGRVDCIANDGKGDLLIDFKLHSQELQHINTKISRYLQLIFYYFGIKDLITLNRLRLAHYFFTSGQIEQIEGSDEMLQRGWQELLRLHNESRNVTTFPPKRSQFCSNCVVRSRHKCPLWKKGD